MLSAWIKFLSSDCRGRMPVKALHKKPYRGYRLPLNFQGKGSNRKRLKRKKVNTIKCSDELEQPFLIIGRPHVAKIVK